MDFKYFFQKFLGRLFNEPIIPSNKTFGYSLVRSERVQSILGKNTKVYPPYYLHGMTLGDYSYIAKNSSITNCSIGKFCSIGPNFCCGLGIHPTSGISTSPMFYSTAKQNGLSLCNENQFEESRITVIGNDVFIGANVTVLDGVRIGDGVIIGAGAVVTKDIPPYAIAVGIPATVKKYRFDKKIIDELLKKEWWNEGSEELIKVKSSFWSIDSYLSSMDNEG